MAVLYRNKTCCWYQGTYTKEYSHIRFGLRIGADTICEKPLVVNPWNIDGLKIIEEKTLRGMKRPNNVDVDNKAYAATTAAAEDAVSAI